MSFTAPLALLGAALLALPVWAHLKKELDLPGAELPTAHLLESSEADADQRHRLQDGLWLLARILMVTLLVLAAAAPFLRLPVAYGDGSHRSMCIVVDDSMSMMRKDGSGSRLIDQAIARATDIIDALPEESEVCLIASGKPTRTLSSRTSSLGEVRAALEQLREESFRGNDSQNASQSVQRELADARWEQRSAAIIADSTQSAGWSAWLEAKEQDIDFTFEALDAPTTNYTFGAIDAAPTTHDTKLVSLTAEVRGSKDGPIATQMQQGQTTAHETVHIADGVGKVRFDVRPGEEAIRLSIMSSDALPQDDTLIVLPPGHGRLQVLTIGGADDGMMFVESAFARARWSSRVSFRRIEPHRIRSADLEGVTLLMADDPTRIPLSKETLSAYVREGGNLWIGIEKKSSVQAMRDLLDNVLPARVGQVVNENPPIGIEVRVPGSEPRAAGQVTQRLLIEELRPGSQVWANYDDGLPAIASWNLGEGSVTLFTGPLGDQWGTLPFSPTYLPLMTELMIESAPALERHPNALEIGSSHTLRTPPDTVRVAFSNEHGTWSQFSDLKLPGHYTVSVETQRASMRPVPALDLVLRPPLAESSLRTAKPPTSASEEHKAHAETAYRSHPLQGWAFALFGIIFFAEGFARLRPWLRTWLGLASQRAALSRQS